MPTSTPSAADWITLAVNFVTMVAAVGAFFVAKAALGTWRQQIRGEATFETARKMVVSANKLAMYFHAARSPFTDASEFPSDYPTPGNRTAEDEARAWGHVFDNRWKRVYRSYTRLVALLPELRAFFPRDVSDAAESLLRSTRELQFHMQEFVYLTRQGDFGEGPAATRLREQLANAREAVFAPEPRGEINKQFPNHELTDKFVKAHSELITLLRKALHIE